MPKYYAMVATEKKVPVAFEFTLNSGKSSPTVNGRRILALYGNPRFEEDGTPHFVDFATDADTHDYKVQQDALDKHHSDAYK